MDFAVNVRKLFWSACITLLGIYTVYQLVDMQKGWDERPLDEFYSTISRQHVGFPSVTVCPSGTTLQPGLRQFLNEMEFKDEYKSGLQTTYMAFLRMKLAAINEDQTTTEQCSERFSYDECNKNGYRNNQQKKSNFLCNALSVLRGVITLYHEELSIIELIIDLATLQAIDLDKPWEAMEMALQALFEEEMDTTTSTTTEWIMESNFTDFFNWYKKRSVSFTEQYINSNGLDNSIGLDTRERSTITCSWLKKYDQLTMLQDQRLQFSEINKFGDFIMAMKNIFQPVEKSNSVIVYYLTEHQIILSQSEITGTLNKVLRNIIRNDNITWTLDDAIDIYITTGSGRVTDSKIKTTGNESFWLYSSPEKWNSLSTTELNCIDLEYRNMIETLSNDFHDPCDSPSDLCKQFCSNSKILEKYIHSNSDLERLMFYVSHPTYANGKGLKLVPFCYGGVETESFDKKIKKGQINLTETYNFCSRTTQVITDVGICTTIQFNDSNLIPENNNNEIYTEGITIVVDSLSHSNPQIINTKKDYSSRSMFNDGLDEDVKTPMEMMNEPKLLIHHRNEIPLFLGPDSSIATVKSENLYGINEVFVPLQVSTRVYANDLQGKFSVLVRKCRYENEIYDLDLFESYTQKKCIFECKLHSVAKSCGCLPWFVLKKQRKRQNVNVSVCNLFGNKCYEQKMLAANKKLYFSTISSREPDCSCYPDCKEVEYKMDVKSETLELLPTENLNILDIRQLVIWSVNKVLKWYDDNWVIDKSANKFLFSYTRDLLLGTDSVWFDNGDNVTYDVLTLDDKKWCRNTLLNCLIKYRANNLAVIRIDYAEKYFVQKNIVDRMPLNNRIAGYGGTIGLFLGFSFMSIAEFLVWMASKIRAIFRNIRK